MRFVDIYGFPVPEAGPERKNRQIPLCFTRRNRAEAREREKESLRTACGVRAANGQDEGENITRILKCFVEDTEWDPEEEKEK